MPFELQAVLRARQGENFSLQAQYMNPQMGRVLKTIGFDHYYVRGEGCYLYDAEDRRYLDFLSGFGVFALGRGHPAVTRAIHEALDADLPNLVQMDCALLPGLLAEALVHTLPPRHRAGPVHELRGRGGGVGHQVRPGRHQTEPDRLLRPRLPRPHHRCAGAQRGAGIPRRASAPSFPTTCVPFGDIDALARELRTRGRGGLRGRADPGQGREPRLGGLLGRGTDVVPASQDAVGHGRGPSGIGPDRQVLLPRALGTAARHHHGVQGAVGGLRPRGGHALVGPDLRQGLQLDGPRRGALLHLRHEPARHGRRVGHVAGLRRRGRRRPRPAYGGGVRQGPRPSRRAPRIPPGGAGQGAHDRAGLRQARVPSPAAAVDGARDHAHGAVLAARGHPPLPPPRHPHPGRRRQHQRGQAPPAPDRGRGGGRLLRGALDDVLGAASKGSGLFWEVGKTMAKGALRRSPG